MQLIFSKKEREIRKIVKNIGNFLVKELKDEGLISLYIVGTILSKKERTPQSDIDFFGLVSSDFDFKLEKEINDDLKNLKKSLCGGYESRFRGIPLSVFEGGKEEGIVKFLKPERLIQRFPFFKHFWGKKFNFLKDFSIKPMDLKEEALYLIKTLKGSIKSLRLGKENFPFQDFPKLVIELVRVEAQLYYGFKYDPSRKKLAGHLSKKENHIIHRAMELREKKRTREEILKFCNEVENYIKYIEKRIKK